MIFYRCKERWIPRQAVLSGKASCQRIARSQITTTFRNLFLTKRQQNRALGFMFILFWISNFCLPLYAWEESTPSYTKDQPLLRPKRINESQKHLIFGVYYLINQNDLDAAESEFRQVIALDQHNWEAYYFLGRIYSERATSTGEISAAQSQRAIGKAKAFLLRAEDIGMTYDKLHPNLLSRLEQEYPKVAPIYEKELLPGKSTLLPLRISRRQWIHATPAEKKAKIVIETESPTLRARSGQPFEIRALKTNKHDAAVIVGDFLPEEEIQLEGGALYQLEFTPKKPKSIKHLIVVGIGLTIWLIR